MSVIVNGVTVNDAIGGLVKDILDGYDTLSHNTLGMSDDDAWRFAMRASHEAIVTKSGARLKFIRTAAAAMFMAELLGRMPAAEREKADERSNRAAEFVVGQGDFVASSREEALANAEAIKAELIRRGAKDVSVQLIELPAGADQPRWAAGQGKPGKDKTTH
jgi:hypothetical protein